MNVQTLANLIATAVKTARSTIGMAERAEIKGNTVITGHGVFPFVAICPVDIYDGKQVWIQITEDGRTAVVIGD